jgi:hypothetical protein
MSAEIFVLDEKEAQRRVWELSDPGVLDQLFSFGQMLLAEVQQRSAQIDSKLTVMLGLSGAMIAFILAGNELWGSSATAIFGLRWLRAIIAVAVVALLLSIYFTYQGLRLREWLVPSEGDWIQVDLLKDPEYMKRHHILSVLDAHRSHNQLNLIKGAYARRAELYVLAAAILVAGVLLFRIGSQIF